MEREEWRRLAAGLLIFLGIATYFITLLKGAWLSDDYFITLRQVEQLFAGHGIRFNLYERSFLSTSVAYFFIQGAFRLLVVRTGESARSHSCRRPGSSLAAVVSRSEGWPSSNAFPLALFRSSAIWSITPAQMPYRDDVYLDGV